MVANHCLTSLSNFSYYLLGCNLNGFIHCSCVIFEKATALFQHQIPFAVPTETKGFARPTQMKDYYFKLHFLLHISGRIDNLICKKTLDTGHSILHLALKKSSTLQVCLTEKKKAFLWWLFNVMILVPLIYGSEKLGNEGDGGDFFPQCQMSFWDLILNQISKQQLPKKLL